jgi:ribosomal protein L29
MADVKKPAATTKAKAAKAASEVKTLEQLHNELSQLRADQLDSRKSHVQGELVNPRVLTVQRKQIARVLTAINTANRSAVKEEK